MKALVGILLVAGLVCAPSPVRSQEVLNDGPPALELSGVVDICPAVKRSIADEVEVRAVVRTAIELGHPACTVVRCALEGGGDLKEVIAGAREAGAAPEVVSRCSVDAGADPVAVAAVLMLPEIGVKVCYFEPEDAEFLRLPSDLGPPPSADPFPPEQHLSVISPFTFP
jgi:hypothetical protein